MNAPQKMTAHRQHVIEDAPFMAPEMMLVEDRPTLILPAVGLSTGLRAESVEAGEAGDGNMQMVMYRPGEFALILPLDIQSARGIAAALMRMCENQETAAAKMARDALAKAAG